MFSERETLRNSFSTKFKFKSEVHKRKNETKWTTRFKDQNYFICCSDATRTFSVIFLKKRIKQDHNW